MRCFLFLLSAIKKFTANAIFFSGLPSSRPTQTVMDANRWERSKCTQHRPAHGIETSSGSRTMATNRGSGYASTWGLPLMMMMMLMMMSSSVRPPGRRLFVNSHVASLYLVEEFLWNLTKFSRLDVKGQGHSKVKKFLRLTRYLCAWILVKLATNIQHVSENGWKGFQGQKSKVKVIARSNALIRLKDPIDLRLSVRCPPVNTYFAWRDISDLVEGSQTFIPYSQQATPPMYFGKFSRNL